MVGREERPWHSWGFQDKAGARRAFLWLLHVADVEPVGTWASVCAQAGSRNTSAGELPGTERGSGCHGASTLAAVL